MKKWMLLTSRIQLSRESHDWRKLSKVRRKLGKPSVGSHDMQQSVTLRGESTVRGSTVLG